MDSISRILGVWSSTGDGSVSRARVQKTSFAALDTNKNPTHESGSGLTKAQDRLSRSRTRSRRKSKNDDHEQQQQHYPVFLPSAQLSRTSSIDLLTFSPVRPEPETEPERSVSKPRLSPESELSGDLEVITNPVSILRSQPELSLSKSRSRSGQRHKHMMREDSGYEEDNSLSSSHHSRIDSEICFPSASPMTRLRARSAHVDSKKYLDSIRSSLTSQQAESKNESIASRLYGKLS